MSESEKYNVVVFMFVFVIKESRRATYCSVFFLGRYSGIYLKKVCQRRLLDIFYWGDFVI